MPLLWVTSLIFLTAALLSARLHVTCPLDTGGLGALQQRPGGGSVRNEAAAASRTSFVQHEAADGAGEGVSLRQVPDARQSGGGAQSPAVARGAGQSLVSAPPHEAEETAEGHVNYLLFPSPTPGRHEHCRSCVTVRGASACSGFDSILHREIRHHLHLLWIWISRSAKFHVRCIRNELLLCAPTLSTSRLAPI